MQSEKLDKLIPALIKAKGSIKPVVKNHENPYFKSKYADLGAIHEAFEAALANNGLVIVQTSTIAPTGAALETTLYHDSGQFISGLYPLNPIENDPQAVGSAVTYARRYAISALLGIVADEDDDGNAASQGKSTVAAHGPSQKAPAHDAEDVATVSFIPAAVSQKSGSKNGKAWTQYGIKSPSGDWYSTFEESYGKAAAQAKEAGEEITLSYKINGQYKNVVAVKASEAVIEEVPF